MSNLIKIILAVYVISSVACWSAENTNTATVTDSANTNKNTETADAANGQNTANTASETNLKISGSPSETLRALNIASNAKNPAEIKARLSKGSIALIEKSAANQKKSVDELLGEENGAPFKFKEMPEMRNEKISGNTATVEVKPKEATEWQLIPLVAEDGEWKFALDVFFLNLQK